jgi:transposase
MYDILAIDLGKNKSVFCDYDSRIGEHRFGSVPTCPQQFKKLLQEHPGRCIVIEICPHAGWVSDLCRELKLELKVVNTSSEEWKWKKVKNKSDRLDSLKLARMQALGLHRYVHMPDAAVRQWRQLIAYRDDLVRRRTASKNRIRAIFDTQGERWPAGKKGWTAAALAELAKIAQPLGACGEQQLWRGMLQEELTCLRHTQQRLDELEQKLDAMAAASPRVKRLTSTPGVGNRTAEMVIAMLDDPRRFKTVAQVGAYTGLTPRRVQSGEMDRQKGISHAGNRLLRKLLVQASWIGQRYNPWMKETFERISGGKKERKKKAVSAVARQLFVRLWAMDRDQTDWKDPTTRQAMTTPPAAEKMPVG